MGIFSGDSDKGKLAIVFDIGSSSVGAAIFHIHKSKIPKIIYSYRENIQLENDFNFQNFLNSTMKTLDTVAAKASTAGVGAPKKFYCMLASPWQASQTRVVKMEKNVPFTFTSKMADELVKKEIAKFTEEHKEKYKDTGGAVVPIELKNMKTMLNGYATDKPLNQKASEVEMTFLVSMSSEQFLNGVTDAVSKHFHHKIEIKFSSFMVSVFAVTRDLFANQDNFLIFDIGGEITDISMIKKDIMGSSISFPVGLNFMARGISQAMKCSLDEAKSLMSLYKEGHASALTEETLKPAVNKLRTEWLNQLQVALANLSNDISIPATIFLTVDLNYADFFSDLIKKEQFSQYTLTESKFTIRFLGNEELHDAVTFEKDVHRDAFLVLESIYINRFLS